MKRFRIHVETDKIGSRTETEIEVDDDATDAEIEEAARDAMFERIEWGWEPIKDEPTKHDRKPRSRR